MTGEWLQWYYLFYLLPAAIAVLVLLLSGLGGAHSGHSHGAHGGLHLHAHHGPGHLHAHDAGSHAAGAAHGHAAHTHAGASHGQTAHGHAADSYAGHGHGHASATHGIGGGPSSAELVLGFFGVGRAPITIVIGSLMIGWGFFGIIANEILEPILRFPALFIGPSLLIAAAGGLLSAKLFGELAARMMPKDESYAISQEGLLGLTGKVVYAVSETEGRVHVFDPFRTLHVLSARAAPGTAPIAKETEVIIASMDPDGRYVIVEPLGFSTQKPSPVTETKPQVEEQPVLEVRNRDEPS